MGFFRINPLIYQKISFLNDFKLDLCISLLAAFFIIKEISSGFGQTLWFLSICAWLHSWLAVEKLMSKESKIFPLVYSFGIPILFGFWLLFFWEVITVGLKIPTVILPPPSMIAIKFMSSLDILFADFQQTFMKSVLAGYFIGCSSAFIFAVLIDKNDFLRRGLLPVGNFISALPIVGIAPIMVMWFGFDWQSKAAVVTIMTFFPMLVNTVAGLKIANHIDHDVMSTWGSSYWQSLLKMRLPKALPLIFNGLKINTTLALIGAIVAEFFGTPIVGMGFRISVEAQRMSFDLVWAEITMAAIVGSTLYGLLALLERYLTFWHPSFHNR
jgi:NitT/TauT family transport system permease protein